MNLNQFVQLGQSISIVANPQQWHVDVVAEEIGKLLHQLSECGMTRTRTVAQPLDGLSIPYNKTTGHISTVAQNELKAYMRPVLDMIAAESSELEVAAIDTGGISQRLQQIRQQSPLTDSQKQLSEETILCLSRGAYRAAIVIGWCFAYDVIRWWAFDETTRLQKFNAGLSNFTKGKGKRTYQDISSYEDFYSNKAPAEGRV